MESIPPSRIGNVRGSGIITQPPALHDYPLGLANKSGAFFAEPVAGNAMHTRRVASHGGEIVMETDHEKAQYAWDYRWSRVVDCDALLAPVVAKECSVIP